MRLQYRFQDDTVDTRECQESIHNVKYPRNNSRFDTRSDQATVNLRQRLQIEIDEETNVLRLQGPRVEQLQQRGRSLCVLLIEIDETGRYDGREGYFHVWCKFERGRTPEEVSYSFQTELPNGPRDL